METDECIGKLSDRIIMCLGIILFVIGVPVSLFGKQYGVSNLFINCKSCIISLY